MEIVCEVREDVVVANGRLKRAASKAEENAACLTDEVPPQEGVAAYVEGDGWRRGHLCGQSVAGWRCGGYLGGVFGSIVTSMGEDFADGGMTARPHSSDGDGGGGGAAV